MIKNGIFCIEGSSWNHYDIKDKKSVLPILELIDKSNNCGFIFKSCTTEEEIKFLLNKWIQKQTSKKYPILYLAFHGKKGCINLNRSTDLTIDELGEILEGKCLGKIIHFGSCFTLGIHGRKINNFLEKTRALAVMGYATSIDWMLSTGFDLFILNEIQENKLSIKGIKKIQNAIVKKYGKLDKILNFRMEINEYFSIPNN